METRFEQDVQKQIDRLTTKPYQEIESQVTRKRINWYRHNAGKITRDHPGAPRGAHDLLFFEYMGLAETELPVLSETDDEIIWSSRNSCPTLEACWRSGLDTRIVCRAVYERSTQALISQIDPQLRFYRSYQEIRPHSFHCKEGIYRLDFQQMMALAFKEACQAKNGGNKARGAVIVLENKVIAAAQDTTTTESNPAGHAAANAIKTAAKVTRDPNLCGAVLFSTCEPCPMCTSLAVMSNLTTIVYGASNSEPIYSGSPHTQMSAGEIARHSSVMVEVVSGVLEEKCEALQDQA